MRTFFPQEVSRARRSFVGPFSLALSGQTARLDAWLRRLEGYATDGVEHPLLVMDAWTHHRPMRGDRNGLNALAPLVGLLATDLPDRFKERGIALTDTLMRTTDPATLRKWELGLGVDRCTWLRAWNVPAVVAFARAHLKAFTPKGEPTEDWSFALVNDLLDAPSSDPSSHRYLSPERRRRLWDAALDTGMVRANALIDVRYAAKGGQVPPGLTGMVGATDPHTALEWMVPSDTPGGLVDHWLQQQGLTPAWTSPATGASLTWVAFAHASPRLLEHWIAQDPSLLDAPMAKGTWGRRQELHGPAGLVIGGRYVAGTTLDLASHGVYGERLRTWMDTPVSTVRETLMVKGLVIDPALHREAASEGWARTATPWETLAETFVLRATLDEPSFQPNVSTPRPRSRL